MLSFRQTTCSQVRRKDSTYLRAQRRGRRVEHRQHSTTQHNTTQDVIDIYYKFVQHEVGLSWVVYGLGCLGWDGVGWGYMQIVLKCCEHGLYLSAFALSWCCLLLYVFILIYLSCLFICSCCAYDGCMLAPAGSVTVARPGTCSVLRSCSDGPCTGHRTLGRRQIEPHRTDRQRA